MFCYSSGTRTRWPIRLTDLFFIVLMLISRRRSFYKLNVTRNIQVQITGDQVLRSSRAAAAAIVFTVRHKTTRS